MSDSGIIQIMCPKLTCRRILAVPARARGKLVRCRGCGSTIRVPATRGDSAPAAAPTDAGAGQGHGAPGQTGPNAA